MKLDTRFLRGLHPFRAITYAFAASLSVSLTLQGTRVLLFSIAGAILACSLVAQDGRFEWRSSVGGYVTASSPAISPDGATLFVGVATLTGGRAVALSTKDGSSRWALQRGLFSDFIESSPSVSADGTAVYVGSWNGRLYSLRTSDGAINWERSLGSVISSSPAISTNGRIYVGSSDGHLYAFSPTGTFLWAFATRRAIDLSSPAISPDGTIYIGSTDGGLYAVTPAGKEKWRFFSGGEIRSSPAIGADGTVYFGSSTQRMYAVAPDGTGLWDFLVNGPVDASPTLGADGTVYFAADRGFYALRTGVGEERRRWRTELNTGSISSAAIRGDGAIILGGDDGVVRALNPHDGTKIWRLPTGIGADKTIESSPMVAPDGSIFVGSFDGGLYKIKGNGSPLSS